METAGELFDGFVLIAAETKFGAVFHDDEVAAAEPGLDLLDEIDVDDGGAVDAEELRGVELLFKALEGFADLEGALACVEACVVAKGFDAFDLGDRKEADAAVLCDGDAREEGRFGGAAELGEEELEGVGVDGAVNAFADAIESFAEAVGREGFEEIVDGVDLKGLERVLIVGGDEDDGGRAFGGEAGDDLEAVLLGHADVEEEEVRVLRVRGEDRGLAVAIFADDLDVFVRAQEADESAAGERFVIDNEGADHAVDWTESAGILTSAETPRGWMGRSSSVAASP
jgi:hypothetical protein